MKATVRAYRPDDRAALVAVLRAPGIAEQFDMYAGEDGVERLLGDPTRPRTACASAFVDGEPAGFACAILLPAVSPVDDAPWRRARALPPARRGACATRRRERVRAHADAPAGIASQRSPHGNRSKRRPRWPNGSGYATTAGSGSCVDVPARLLSPRGPPASACARSTAATRCSPTGTKRTTTRSRTTTASCRAARAYGW